MGGIEVRSKHVDIHEGSGVQWSNQHRLQKIRSIMEAVNWVCEDALDDHMWVSELTISCQEAKVLEALQYDLANPCIVQWGVVVLGQ